MRSVAIVSHHSTVLHDESYGAKLRNVLHRISANRKKVGEKTRGNLAEFRFAMQ